MDDRTLEALRDSIAHWEDVVANPKLRTGPYDCELCGLFFFHNNHCFGCPVRGSSGFSGCKGTPYTSFVSRPSVATAQAELDFLKSLLPDTSHPTPNPGDRHVG